MRSSNVSSIGSTTIANVCITIVNIWHFMKLIDKIQVKTNLTKRVSRKRSKHDNMVTPCESAFLQGDCDMGNYHIVNVHVLVFSSFI